MTHSNNTPRAKVKQRLEVLQGHLATLPLTVQTMAKERRQVSFNPRELTYFLDGSEERTKLKERIFLEIERNSAFRMDDVYDLNKEEWRVRTMEKFRSFVHHLTSEPIDIFRLRMELVSLVDPGFWTRIGVHYGLFFSTLSGQANATQFSYWVQKGAMALNGLVGCFAMTELGHGSNVAGLETTSTFDSASDQFIINTPTITGTKWWIGGAAHTATHWLIVNGKDYGVKPFVVQLRDTQDFSLMPGINIGDCGMKMGRNGIDNGWIQFTNVRIPRTSMLMKYTKVSRDGMVVEPPLSQLAYGALIGGRVSMVADSGNVAKKALTIAIRYGLLRRQFAFGDAPKSEKFPHLPVETQLMDYTIHQHRLLPLLAQAYAMHFTSVEMTKLHERLTEQLNRLQPGDKDTEVVLQTLKETHATSAGLKAFCTWNCLNTIEQCRQSLGGHGYSSYTGLAMMYNDFAVQCSWEGDNTILTLQSGRYLIGCYREAKEGKKQSIGVNYLNKLPHILTKQCHVTETSAMVDLNVIGESFDVVCANLVKKLGEDFEACLKRGLSPDMAYEETAISRLFTAKNHCYGYLFHRFHDAIKNAPPNLKPTLVNLCALYGLYNIQENSGNFIQYKYLNGAQIDMVKEQVLVLCHKLRTEASGLIDAFNLPDFVLNSPFGRYDGDIYTHYFDKVKARNPPSNPPPYFEKVIKPLIHRQVVEQDEPEDEENLQMNEEEEE